MVYLLEDINGLVIGIWSDFFLLQFYGLPIGLWPEFHGISTGILCVSQCNVVQSNF